MNPVTDLQRTVVLQGAAPQLESCDAGSVEIKWYRPAQVVMRADVACRSMVILGDAWFPGWKAYVDNRPAQIYAAYTVLRGGLLHAATHELSLVFHPSSV